LEKAKVSKEEERERLERPKVSKEKGERERKRESDWLGAGYSAYELLHDSVYDFLPKLDYY
jgi:hypothetical protein